MLEVGTFNFTGAHILNCCLGVVMYTYYAFTKNWFMSNIFGLAVAFNSLEVNSSSAILIVVHPARHFYGRVRSPWRSLFLRHLFCFWNRCNGHCRCKHGCSNQGSSPTQQGLYQILVPKEYMFLDPAEKLEFSMLGLGDIVVPGLFIALALRYDLYRYHYQNPGVSYKRHMYRFPKPYFFATLAAYVAGLVLTMTVMHVFKAAQPALLYLSPACAAAALVTALIRKEFPALWAYKEISIEERLEKAKETKETKENEATEKEDVKEDGITDTKYEAQAIKKKISGIQVSGDGGDVESLDDTTAEDLEAVDSEWTQGGAEDGDEVWVPFSTEITKQWDEKPIQMKRRTRHGDAEREGWTSGGDLADVEETPRSRSEIPAVFSHISPN